MGNSTSLVAPVEPLTAAEIGELQKQYSFKPTVRLAPFFFLALSPLFFPLPQEINTLHSYFSVIAGSVEDDGVIDMDEFHVSVECSKFFLFLSLLGLGGTGVCQLDVC
jgi:hypothetical protein